MLRALELQETKRANKENESIKRKSQNIDIENKDKEVGAKIGSAVIKALPTLIKLVA
jgi:hypothetical protein